MAQISKNITTASKFASEIVANQADNFKPSDKAKECFARKPYYMEFMTTSNNK